MAQMNVSLPEGLKAWVESRVSNGRFSSASDYVRDLIRRDEEKARKLADLQAAIDDGIASGVDPREPAEIIEAIIAKHRAAA
jgi:antitoxin ParD1/3/4